MGKEELSVPGTLVKKSNAIIRTRLSVQTVEASRLLAHLVACIRTDDENLTSAYSVAASDILPYIGGENYRRIKATCKELATAIAETEEPDPDGSHPIYSVRPFFTGISYRKGIITASFNPLMWPFLISLKNCFTQYNLLEYLALPSFYSQRMFEILKSWSGMPEVLLPIEDLHRMLDSPASFRADFRQFRTRVLEKAHKDITEKTSFRYEWEPVKVGRSVEKIRFIFTPRRKALALKEQEKAKEEKRRRLLNQRFLRAVECAKAKGGDCRTMDNVRIVCKVCREKRICETMPKKTGLGV